MLVVRPKDYFELKYDVTTPNKVDSLAGKDYIRDSAIRQVSRTITKVKVTDAANKEAEAVLPYGPSLNPLYYDDNGAYDVRLLGALWHAQVLDRNWGYGEFTGPEYAANQCVLLGTFSTTFTDLDLPDGAVPTCNIRYRTVHKAYSKEYSDSAELLKTIESEGDGALITDDWEDLWIGAGLRKTNKRSQSIADYTEQLTTLRQNYALSFSDIDFETAYAPLGRGPADADYRNFMHVEGLDWSSLDDVVKLDAWRGSEKDDPQSHIATYLKGNVFKLAQHNVRVVDRNTCVVSGTIPIYNAHAGEADYGSTVQLFSATDWVKDLTVEIAFPQPEWSGVAFKHKREDSEDLYPYTFSNTRIANADDTAMGVPWKNYYPKLLLDKFAEGKYYATIKVRVGFALANDIRVDTLIQVYDLNNQIISRAGVPCTFRVKRIVKSFGNNEFYYIINCLEE